MDLSPAGGQRAADSLIKRFFICFRQTVERHDIFEQTGPHVARAATDIVFAEDVGDDGILIDELLDSFFHVIFHAIIPFAVYRFHRIAIVDEIGTRNP